MKPFISKFKLPEILTQTNLLDKKKKKMQFTSNSKNLNICKNVKKFTYYSNYYITNYT